jgi:hypothetical protein
MLSVLEFAEDVLKGVPHSRREQMTLGEFMDRHNYIGGHLNTVMSNKLKQVLGESIEGYAADVIDWEFGGVRTNPIVHMQEDAKIRHAASLGKGYSAEETASHVLESNLSGKAAQELGNVKQFGYVNPVTMQFQSSDENSYYLEQVLKDAKRLTALPAEATYLKNLYENEIMKHYSGAEFNQEEVERIIKEYTESRLKGCLLSDEFRQKVRTNDGHYYVKMLKETIADELGLSNPAQASDFAFHKIL